MPIDENILSKILGNKEEEQVKAVDSMLAPKTEPVVESTADENILSRILGTPVQEEKKVETPTTERFAAPKVEEVSTTPELVSGWMPIDPTSEFAGAEPVVGPAPPAISYNDLTTNDDYFNIINKYATVRYNESFDPSKESKQEFVDRWMSAMRSKQLNVTLEGAPELTFMRNLTLAAEQDAENILSNLGYKSYADIPEDQKTENMKKAEAVANAHLLFNETAGFYDEGGQKGFTPVVDFLGYVLSDPATYIGLGAGKFALGQAARAGLSRATQRLITMTTAGATEGIVGSASNIVDQRIRQETERAFGIEPTDLNKTEIAVAGVLSGVLGLTEGAAAIKGGERPLFGLKDELEQRRAKGMLPAAPDSKPSKVEVKLSDKLEENMDNVVRQYVDQYGREVLEGQVSEASGLVNPVIRHEISKRAVRVALHVIDTDPAFKLKDTEKVSDAIERVFSKIDTGEINDDVLADAITAAGLTPEQFSAANKVTVREAARIMQDYSVVSRLWKSRFKVDRDFERRINELYNVKRDIPGLSRANLFFRDLMRKSKIWITTGIDTTMRNVAGTGIGLTFKTAAQILESSVYLVGRTAMTPFSKDRTLKRVGKDFADEMKDAFGVYVYLRKQGLSKDVMDRLLSEAPSLRARIDNTYQEADARDVGKITRFFNSLNAAQDAFIRRAVFSASVDQQLKRQGKDLYKDFIDTNTAVPREILVKAIDDSLKATYSYMPKARREGSGTEGFFEKQANRVVNLIEEFYPFGVAIPFPRFMANAMAFQYRYSPAGYIGAGQDILAGLSQLNKGNKAAAGELLEAGKHKLAQGTVGLGALVGAYYYRKNNKDTEWYNIKREDGSTINITNIFPIAPYFAVADLLVRIQQGVEPDILGAVQVVSGLKLPAGTQYAMFKAIQEGLQQDWEGKAIDRMSETIGKITGDFGGRFTQPFVVKNFYDYANLFREDGSIARDPNVYEQGDFLAAAGQRVQSKIPVLKEGLPEATVRLKAGPVTREGEFFNRLVGFRPVPVRSPVEIEVARLRLDPYRLFGSSTGDKTYDNAFIKEANKRILQRTPGLFTSKLYQRSDDTTKALMLKKNIQKHTAEAREFVNKLFTKDLNRLNKIRFNKLSTLERLAVNKAYKADKGETLEQAKDYESLDNYLKVIEGELEAASKFAIGGAALGKALAKKATGEATSGLSKQIDLLRSMKSKPEAEQTAKMLETPAAPAPASTYNFPSKVFDDADYQAAEAKMIGDLGADKVNELKATQPKQFANLLHSNAFDSKFSGLSFMDKLKLKKEFPNPYKPSEVEKVESPFAVSKTTGLDADQEAQLAKAEGQVPGESYAEDYYNETVDYYAQKHEQKKNVYVGKPEARRGVVEMPNKPEFKDDRNELIDQVKAVRINSFPNIVKMFPDNDEIVLAKAQGEYRFKYQAEADPANAQSMKKFKALVNKEQKDYNNLAEKYKNTPPVVLNHGSKEGERAVDDLVEKGFGVPSQYSGSWHSELNTGAISFQTDFSLPFFAQDVGGRGAENFLRTLMPREDYEFLRVNIPQNVYQTSRDINQVMRSLTGSETVARPVGIPRTKRYHEQEDAFPEADKLVLIKSKRMAGEKFSVAGKMEEERIGLVKYFKDKNYKTDFTPKEQEEYYRNVKKYLNNFLDQAKLASPGKGFGSNYEKYLGKTTAELGEKGEEYIGAKITPDMKKSGKGELGTFNSWTDGEKERWVADSSNKFFNTLDRVAELMKQRGSTQKSKNLRNLRRYLALTSDQSKGVKVNKNAAQKVRQITPKLRQGGLASRR